MGYRFRKSISLGKGARLNIGKRGIGISAGIKGARIGIGSRGSYTSFGIPGTGLYNVSYLGSHKRSTSSINHSDISQLTEEVSAIGIGCWAFLLGFVGFLCLFGAPGLGVILIIAAIVLFTAHNSNPKTKALRKFQSAQKLLSENQNEEAIRLLKQAVELYPCNLKMSLLLGVSLHDAHKYEEAITFFQNNVNTFSANIAVHEITTLLLADCYYQIKNYKEAINISQRIPETSANFLQSLQISASAFHAIGDNNVAIEVLQKAPLKKRNLDNDLKHIHYLLGMFYEEVKNTDKALRHYRRVYADDTNYQNVNEAIERLEGKHSPVLPSEQTISEKNTSKFTQVETEKTGTEVYGKVNEHTINNRPETSQVAIDKNQDDMQGRTDSKNICKYCGFALTDNDLMNGLCPHCKKLF